MVVVSHPQKQHAYETAVAAQKAGLLAAFITFAYATGSGWLSPARLARVPAIGRRLAGRRHAELDSAKVLTIPWYHAMEQVAPRFGVKRRSVQSWANDRFDRAVGRQLAGYPAARLVHAFEASALHTFESARRRGLVTMLDVPSANEFLVRTTAEEAVLNGFERRPSVSPWQSQLRREYQLADWLLAPSALVRDCLVEAGAEAARILVLPYGADPAAFAPPEGHPKRPFRVLYVGRIDLAKGLRYLLEAWQRLALPDAELVLVGAATAEGQELLRRYGGPNIRWFGQLSHPKVREQFQQASAFAFPSLAEGSALVVYEAMASALPVITTPEAGSVVRSGEDGLIVPRRNVAALMAALERFYREPDLCRRMGRSGRQLILERYTWDQYHARLGGAYRAIVAGDRPEGLA